MDSWKIILSHLRGTGHTEGNQSLRVWWLWRSLPTVYKHLELLSSEIKNKENFLDYISSFLPSHHSTLLSVSEKESEHVAEYTRSLCFCFGKKSSFLLFHDLPSEQKSLTYMPLSQFYFLFNKFFFLWKSKMVKIYTSKDIRTSMFLKTWSYLGCSSTTKNE